MKDFSIQIANDFEFHIVRDVLVGCGISVYPATLRARAMDDFSYLGWNGNDVCRTNVQQVQHYSSALEFLAQLACPSLREKLQLREKLRNLEGEIAAVKAQLGESA